MWFIADLFERYTSFTKSIVKIATAEAEATRSALLRLRDRRTHHETMLPPDRADEPAPVPSEVAAASETVAVVETVTVAEPAAAREPAEATPTEPVVAEAVVEADTVAVVEAAPEPVAEPAPVAAEAPAPAAAMPMGVRGDVVTKWVSQLAEAERRHMPDLLETLRKDKKVRVAELQIICAETLGETPQPRKKVEHLEVLRRHFAPSERSRAAAPTEMQLSAN